MEDPKILRPGDIAPDPLPGAGKNSGWLKRIIYPHTIGSKGITFGIAEVLPGYSPHRWHTHTIDKGEGFEFIYPKEFEEIYHIIKGRGVVQWKEKDGRIKEKKVKAGDTILFPIGVVQHQLLNNSKEKMLLVFCGSPPVKVALTQPKTNKKGGRQ